MRNKMLLMLTMLPAVLPTAVYAHTGEHHGNFLSTLVHFITSPVHLAISIFSAIVLVVIIRRVMKNTSS
jgi:hypothetical protein